ncbi:TonB family protein [Piscinibacter terrae]|uniref:Protein TonB n=1 Tax=Piscinibacter terrae TaxID=2496871 RepID=A0A3N7ITF5_9BURK|nr:TonB family protein [Albitalea terrae]RQP22122.1 TonB family protein [Albitalea terrae]
MLSSQTRYPRAAAPSSFKPAAFAAVLIAALAGTSQAQTVPPANGAGPGQSASERASKEGDKVFQWIRILSDKPRKAAAVPAAAPEKAAVAPAPAPAKVATRAAPKPAATDASANSAETAAKSAPREEQLAAAKPVAQPDPTTETKDASASTAAASPVVEVEEEIVLTPLVKSEPQFPASLMRQLRKGLVQVAFTVQPDGSVTDARAVTSTHARLSPSAVSAVQQWKFQPIRHAEQAVVDLGFNLE